MKKASKARKIRILLADREDVFRLGVRQLFALEDDLRMVAQATSGEQVAGLAQRFRPHVVMVQAEIAAEPPGNLMEKIRRQSPHSKLVIVLTGRKGEADSRYLQAGAAGVVSRSAPLGEFVKEIRNAMRRPAEALKSRGPLVIGPSVAPQFPLRPAQTLTERERTVIGCLMQGFRNRDISQYLSIAEQTVKNHLRAIFDKVGVSDRLELVLYAIHHKLEVPVIDVGRLFLTPGGQHPETGNRL
jgi:DNA-binding NarL/FixJ family response regulator